MTSNPPSDGDPWAPPQQPPPYPPPQQSQPPQQGQLPQQGQPPAYPPPGQPLAPTPGFPASPGYPSAPGYQPGYQPGFQQGYQPGPGYQVYGQPPSPQSRDGISIAAFILGIIALVPFAIGFGIAGLVRTANHKRKGRWMAVTGLVLSVLWIAGFVVIGITANHTTAHRAADGSITKRGTIAPGSLRVGDCVELPATLDNARRVTVTPCTELHNAQVYADVALAGGSWPGESEVQAASKVGCVSQLTTFLTTRPTAALIANYLYPSEANWKASDDHTAHCLLVDTAKDFTGDVREDK